MHRLIIIKLWRPRCEQNISLWLMFHLSSRGKINIWLLISSNIQNLLEWLGMLQNGHAIFFLLSHRVVWYSDTKWNQKGSRWMFYRVWKGFNTGMPITWNMCNWQSVLHLRKDNDYSYVNYMKITQVETVLLLVSARNADDLTSLL